MYTLEKRKMIYIMTRKPVWYHTHCITPWRGNPVYHDPNWVIGDCDLCRMDVEGQDWWNGCSYKNSQKKLFDNIELNKKYWY